MTIITKTVKINGFEILVSKTTGMRHSDLFRKTVKIPPRFIAISKGRYSRSCNTQSEAIRQLLKQLKNCN